MTEKKVSVVIFSLKERGGGSFRQRTGSQKAGITGRSRPRSSGDFGSWWHTRIQADAGPPGRLDSPRPTDQVRENVTVALLTSSVVTAPLKTTTKRRTHVALTYFKNGIFSKYGLAVEGSKTNR